MRRPQPSSGKLPHDLTMGTPVYVAKWVESATGSTLSGKLPHDLTLKRQTTTRLDQGPPPLRGEVAAG